MRVVSTNSEQSLVHSAEKLRKDHTTWSAIFIYVSKLSDAGAKAEIDALQHSLQEIKDTENVSLFLLYNKDMLLLMPKADQEFNAAIMQKTCGILSSDSLAKKPLTDKGNDLCVIFSTRDDLIELHRIAMEYQNNAMVAAMEMMVVETPVEYKPDTEKFTIAKRQREYRLRPKVLIAEDQPFSREMAVEMIKDKTDVVEAENGLDTLRMYVQHAPDIVFLDIDMPEMSGLVALNTITAMDPEAFVVMLTASNDKANVLHAKQHLARGYIVKPFTKQKIEQYFYLYKQHKVALDLQQKAAAKAAGAATVYEPNLEKFMQMKEQRAKRKRISVLMAKDQLFNGNFLTDTVDKKHDVLGADNGVDTLKVYEFHAPDILFIDINIPGMDCFSVLSAVSKMDSDAYVVVMAGSQSLLGGTHHVLQNKINGYLIKPFTKQKVDQHINSYRQKFSHKAHTA